MVAPSGGTPDFDHFQRFLCPNFVKNHPKFPDETCSDYNIISLKVTYQQSIKTIKILSVKDSLTLPS